jgi:hypothetical protein
MLPSLLVLGCGAGWRRADGESPSSLPMRQQVQVWQGRTVRQWHALELTADSVRGIPYFQPVTCDSCRQAVARETVDSIRLGNPVAGFWKSVSLVVGVLAGFVAIYCWEGCTSN